jgi:hypothetical protein
MPKPGRLDVDGDRSEQVRLKIGRHTFRMASMGIEFDNTWLCR